jgi:hypothetical protein
MKDFGGNLVSFKNPSLDWNNKEFKVNTFNQDDVEHTTSFTVERDGILIMGCNYRQISYSNLVDDTHDIRIASVSSANSAPGENRIIVQLYKNTNYRIYGKRVYALFIPYL